MPRMAVESRDVSMCVAHGSLQLSKVGEKVRMCHFYTLSQSSAETLLARDTLSRTQGGNYPCRIFMPSRLSVHFLFSEFSSDAFSTPHFDAAFSYASFLKYRCFSHDA